MIRDALKKNETVDANSALAEKVAVELPGFIDKDGRFLSSKLESALSDVDVDMSRETYGLSFVGKSYGDYQYGIDTETVLTPHVVHNSKEENSTSENVYLIGDNIDALKHLRDSYRGAFECIYIDPPYNTAGDGFVYNDSYNFNVTDLQDKAGLTEEEAERVMNLHGSSTHSAWLTMMYPRLLLAHDLLSEDGVIFISIDDNEMANLKLLMDDIFGPNTFEADIIVISNPGGRDYKQVAVTNEHLLMYSRRGAAVLNEIAKEAEFKKFDSQGGYELRELRNRNPRFNSTNRPNLFYPFYVNPDIKDKYGYSPVSLEKTDEFYIETFPTNSKGDESCWRWGQPRSGRNIKENDTDASQVLAKFTRNGKWNVYEKNRRVTTKVKSVWDGTGMRSEDGTRAINALFGQEVFDHPKPVDLVKRCIEIATDEDSLVLDFFSGSATTAEAVLRLNAEDGGNRSFFMVQMPEVIYSGRSTAATNAYELGYSTIDEIGRARIAKAVESIRQNDSISQDALEILDLGFKVYRIDTPQVNTLDSLEKFVPQDDLLDLTLDYVETHNSDLAEGKETILVTLTNRDGYTFNPDFEFIPLGNYSLPVVGSSAYIVAEGFNQSSLENLITELETKELEIHRLVVLVYSVSFSTKQAIEIGLKNMRNTGDIDIVEVY